MNNSSEYVRFNAYDDPHGFLYPRAVDNRSIDYKELIKLLAEKRHCSEGNVLGIVEDFVAVITEQLKQGRTVTVDNLGSFSPILEFIDADEPDMIRAKKAKIKDGDGILLTSLCRFISVGYRVDKELVKKLFSHQKFTLVAKKFRSNGKMGNLEQREQYLMQCLEEKQPIYQIDYREKCGISAAQASNDFRYYLEKGLIEMDKVGPTKVYYKAGTSH